MKICEIITEWRNIYSVKDLSKVPYDSSEPEKMYFRPEDDWHGPQEGKYINLMLRGMKPATIVTAKSQEMKNFLPYIQKGIFKLAAKNRKDRVITLPGEEWRGPKLLKLFDELKTAAKKKRENEYIGKLHAKIGMLLGIPKEAVRNFVQTYS